MNEPSDETVREALATHGDPELSRLTSGDGSFVLRPASTQGERFALYHVILVEVPHPMSVMLAASEDETLITSGRPEAVEDRRRGELDSVPWPGRGETPPVQDDERYERDAAI